MIKTITYDEAEQWFKEDLNKGNSPLYSRKKFLTIADLYEEARPDEYRSDLMDFIEDLRCDGYRILINDEV